eukprot:m.745952 g.745952  ORF g.745952 m.745952 type:complete len:60 (-) comp23130_c0_seq1:2044-2223(-)
MSSDIERRGAKTTDNTSSQTQTYAKQIPETAKEHRLVQQLREESSAAPFVPTLLEGNEA